MLLISIICNLNRILQLSKLVLLIYDNSYYYGVISSSFKFTVKYVTIAFDYCLSIS